MNVADEAEVDRGFFLVHDHRRALRRFDEPGIDATDPNGGYLKVTARREDAGVDEPIQNHRRHFERFLVGDAPALDHAGVDAERFRELGRLRPSAVNEHDTDPELMQERNLFDEGAGRRLAGEDGAARLHDKRLAFVHADVRRSLLERRDDDRPFRRGFHEASLKISYSTAICAHMRFFAW